MNQEELLYLFKNHSDANIRRHSAEQIAMLTELNLEILSVFVDGLLDSDSGVRDVVFRTLISQENELASYITNSIVSNIASDDIQLRNICGEILKRTGKYSPESFLKYLEDNDQHTRQFAVDVCANIDSPCIREKLAGMIYDDSTNVRASVYEALGILNIKESIASLIARYEYEDDLKPLIIDTLGKYEDEIAEKFILDLLKIDDDIFIKLACLDSLSTFSKSEKIIDALLNDISQYPESIQSFLLKTIVFILERLNKELPNNDGIMDIAVNALHEDDENVIYSALKIIGAKMEAEHIPLYADIILKEIPLILYTFIANLLSMNDSDFTRKLLDELIKDSYHTGSVQNLLSLLPKGLSHRNEDESVCNLQEMLFLYLIEEKIAPLVSNIESIELINKANYQRLLLKYQAKLPDEFNI
jgi:HEAT repeat protein